jgi:hypothetical protein
MGRHEANWFWECATFLLCRCRGYIEFGCYSSECIWIHYWTIISTLHVYVLGKFNDWSLNAITVFNPSHQLKKILLIVVPYIAFGWYWLTISGQDVTPLYVLRDL